MEKVSTARIALKWGLILALISIAITTVYYTLNTFSLSWYNYVITFVTYFGILFLALKEFRSLNNDEITFGQGFGLGMLLFFTCSIIYSVYDFVYKSFIDTTVNEKILKVTEEMYESMGFSPDMIEQSMQQAAKTMDSPLSALYTVFGLMLYGVICSLIMAAIMKKTKPVFE